MTLEVIAHRGYSARAPENTLSALEHALRCGASALEWDLQRSREGIPIVLHDETLDRTTNGEGLASDFPLEALARLDAGSWFHPLFAGEPLPTLHAVLRQVGQRAERLYPEIKRGATRSEVQRILDEVLAADLLGKTVFISMDWDALDRIGEVAPTSQLGYIVETPERYAAGIQRVRDDARLLLDLDYRIVLQNPELTAEAVAAGIDLAVWTVNTPEEATQLADAGVTRFTTNEVERLLRWQRSREAAELL